MSFDYDVISEDVGIKVQITKGSGNPLTNLTLISAKETGKQEYVYPTSPQEAYRIIEELLRRKLICESRFAETNKEVKDLEDKMHSNPYYTP